MTYFNLRKRDPEPEPDEDFDETEATEEAPPAPPAGALGALKAGLCGPGAWITARFGPSTSWTVHVGSVWAIGFYGGMVAAGIVLAWALAILAFVPKEALDRLTAAIERRGTPTAPPEEADTPAVDPIVPLLWRLIADAPGTHLKTLTADLQKATPDQPLDKAVVRAHLTTLGIPTKPSVRDVRGKVNEGVHRDDLTAWEQALPAPSPDPSPEARSGPVATAVTCDVGDAPTPVATPSSPFRRLLSRGAE